MNDQPASIPVAGSLSAKVIRACTKHRNCALDCPRRRVEDLGEIARVDSRTVTLPDPSEGLKSGKPVAEQDPTLIDRLKEGLGKWLP